MPPTLADRVSDILTAIAVIQTALANTTPEELGNNISLRFSVERAFEVICEASRRLPDDVKARERSIDWRRMVDFGNQLRHAYHRINPQILIEIAVRDLPPLKAFAQRIIVESKQ